MQGQTSEPIVEGKLHRKLRKSMTDAELALWRILKCRQMCGVKFRRQHPFEEYVLDFVSLDKMLVVEVDGSQHAEHAAYDECRTRKLEAAGFLVLRFTNLEVLKEFEGVKERIWLALEVRGNPSPPCPSP